MEVTEAWATRRGIEVRAYLDTVLQLRSLLGEEGMDPGMFLGGDIWPANWLPGKLSLRSERVCRRFGLR
jgi:hypothetical protein